MTDDPNQSAKEALAEEKRALTETKAQSGREATADYRAREAAADDNANRLKVLRLAREAEAADTQLPTTAPKARRAKKTTARAFVSRPDQLTTENDG